ncbi:MAG TPA: IPExxxVDY family protein [Edaphocola sp.]|nr:IPExxxVDY family protein [Edaphocola sp.]
MGKKHSLDNSLVAEDFFEDYLLIGVQASVPTTIFCTEIKSKLGFNFKRENCNDAKITFIVDKKSGLGIPGTLFQNIPTEEQVCFGFYRYMIPFSMSPILLYENKQKEYALIKEEKEMDFIFLIPDENLEWQQKPFIYWLSQLSSVQNCSYLDIETLGDSKMNLIL